MTQEEWEREECNAECSSFMEYLHQKLGPCAELRDLDELGVEEYPQYNPYEDKLQNAKTFPMFDEEPE